MDMGDPMTMMLREGTLVRERSSRDEDGISQQLIRRLFFVHPAPLQRVFYHFQWELTKYATSGTNQVQKL